MSVKCKKCENAVLIGHEQLGKPVYECKKLKVFVEMDVVIKCPAFERKPIVLLEKEIPMAEEYLVRAYLEERIP